jgi:hypothetical protein
LDLGDRRHRFCALDERGEVVEQNSICNDLPPSFAIVDQRSETHLYEVRPCKDHRGVHLISDALPFGRLWYGEPNAVSNAIDYAKVAAILSGLAVLFQAAALIIPSQ